MNLENFTLENLSKQCRYGSRSRWSSKILPSKFFMIGHPRNFYSSKISSYTVLTVTPMTSTAGIAKFR